MEKNYKMIIETLDTKYNVIKEEVIENKDTIISELGYTLKESREYSVVYSKNGLYNIVAYNYIMINGKKSAIIRRTFELDLL